MAPVDDAIAKARAERKKTMEQDWQQRPVAEKLANEKGAIAGCATLGFEPYRQPTLAEQAEKSAKYHLDEHVKAQGAAYFLTAHPEFEEFIKLIRSGAVSLIVLLLCVASAFSQVPVPSPEPQLSTAERTAIQSLEKQKQDAQQSYQQALQVEMAISREFATAHAGYHLDGQNFAVQKDHEPPTPPAVPEKK